MSIVSPKGAKNPAMVGEQKVKSFNLSPDESNMTMRARRKGFIGTIKTNLSPFETDVYIFDDTLGVVMFCQGDTTCFDRRPNKKKFPSGMYRAYSLRALGLDGRDILSLYYNGRKCTLRYIGNVPKRYVIHDKFVFRVKYVSSMKTWQYFDPVSKSFKTLPFPATELVFNREDFKNYAGELPKSFREKKEEPVIKAEPKKIVEPVRLGAPKVVVTPAPPVETPKPRTERVEPQVKLAEVKVRYLKDDGTLVGYGVLAPDGTPHKYSVAKLIQLAKEDKVAHVKVVNRGNGEFLQGVGISLESLPTRRVN